jgi:hypothetical protein
VRLYKFGKEAERIQKTDQLTASEPATRIGDTLERVLAESSSLPLGAIVLLSDGADNSGGIDLDTIADPQQRIPVHTIGFGREHPDRDVEITDAVLPARALPQSRLSALVTFSASYGSPAEGQARCATAARCWPRRKSVEGRRRAANRIAGVQCAGLAGPKTLEIGIDPLPGEENTQQQLAVTRLVNVETRKPRILYIRRRAALGVQIHPPRLPITRPQPSKLASMLRTTQNKIYRQGTR